MRVVSTVGLMIFASATSTLSADEQPAADIPETVYIDPAAFLPEAFAEVVEETIEDVPLTEAAPIISELAGVPCVVVEDLFEKWHMDSGIRVTLHSNLPLYMALDRLCRDSVQLVGERAYRIAWLIDGEELRFLPRREALDTWQDHTYEVGELLERFGDEPVKLIDLIQSHTFEAEWKDIDGIGGEISLANDELRVTQTFASHRRIAALLEALRGEADIVYVDRSPTTAAVHEAFGRNISESVDGMPLAAAIELLEDGADVDIRVVPNLSSFEKVDLEAMVKCDLVDQDLRTTLEGTLQSFAEQDLGFAVWQDAIWISNSHDPYDFQETVLYRADVNDIISLIDKIQNDTSGEWIDIDGIGGEINAAPGHYLIVTQSQQVHREIAALLSQLDRESE